MCLLHYHLLKTQEKLRQKRNSVFNVLLSEYLEQ